MATATPVTGARSSYQTTTETRQVRDFSKNIFRYLEHSLGILEGGESIGPDGTKITVAAKIKSGTMTAVKHEWQEKDIFQQPNLTTSGTVNTTGTTLNFTADANVRVGDIFRTGSESVLISALASTSQATIVRLAGTADTIGTAVLAKYIGNANLELGTLRAQRTGGFTILNNSSQIIRTPFGQSRTEAEIEKYEDQKSEAEIILDGGIQHAVERELATIFGNKVLPTVNTSYRAMGGLHEYLTTNVYSASAGGYAAIQSTAAPSYTGGAGMSTDGCTFDEFVEEFCPTLFRYDDPSRKRVRYLVAGQIMAILWKQWFKGAGATVYLDMLTDEFGYDVPTLRTPFGKFEYLFSGAVERIEPGWCFAIDPQYLKKLYIPNSNAMLFKNRQANDVDGTYHEFLTEQTLEVKAERLMGIMQGLVRAAI